MQASFRERCTWVVALVMCGVLSANGAAQGGAVSFHGPSSSDSPYLVGMQKGMIVASILTTGDAITAPTGGAPYRLAGIPDGCGLFGNGDGTFTLLVNHELSAGVGVPHAHSTTGGGAFISKWVIRQLYGSSCGFDVVSGEDLVQQVAMWNAATSTYDPPALGAVFDRFCSADLPAKSAFKFGAFGFDGRIFMNGEEANGGHAWAHVVTGAPAGTSYELPRLGRMAFENVVANPATGLRTVVVALDDTTPGQVYVYVGTKQNSGNPVQRAGLTNGSLYGVVIPGQPIEPRDPTPALTSPFSLAPLGDVTGQTSAQLDATSDAAGVTRFLRPEDGAWDPENPNDFYFVTTDRIDQVKDGLGSQIARSRLRRLRFFDRTQPELGGTMEILLDGTEAQNMLDNITIDRSGHVLMQEDTGGSAHNAKVWQYDIATDTLKLLAMHDPLRFGDVSLAAKAPFNLDEESSGIIDAGDVLGRGWFIAVVQAHYPKSDPYVVEGGQILAIYDPDSDSRHRSGFNPDLCDGN